jgi:hypothetical protein
VTTVGVFRLTGAGLEIESLMPGVDLERDVLGTVDVDIRIPPGGPALVPDAVVTGRGFVPGEQIQEKVS